MNANNRGEQDNNSPIQNQGVSENDLKEILSQCTVDMELRAIILKEILKRTYSTEGLSDWLKQIGRNPKGYVEDKRNRLHEYEMSLSPSDFRLQILEPLVHSHVSILKTITKELNIADEGGKNILIRRIFREIGYKEGLLQRFTENEKITRNIVRPYIYSWPVLKQSDYEEDYYKEFHNEMSEIFGKHNIRKQYPLGRGSKNKIDFFIGNPRHEGIGIEMKCPINKLELRNACGQIDEYIEILGQEIIIVLFSHNLEDFEIQTFEQAMRRKNIEVIRKP